MSEQKTRDSRAGTTANGLMALKSGKTTFTYMDKAGGTPVVCIHCSGGTHRQWVRNTDALPGYRILAPDLHGHGGTPSPHPISSTFRNDVEMVITLAQAIDGPLHLVGHSYGGFVALHAAMVLREGLLSLTLIEPAAFHLLQQDSEADAWSEINKVARRQMTQVHQGNLEGSAAEFMAYWTGMSVEESRKQRSIKFIAQTMPSIASIWDSLFRQPYTLNEYAHFPFPTLLVRGTETTRAADRIIHMLSRTMAHSQRVDIPGAGHMSPLTHPEAVFSALRIHLNRTSTRITIREGKVNGDSSLARA